MPPDPASAVVSPIFGRPSPAADLPWKLGRASAATAGIRADGADGPWCALRAATVVGIRHRLAGVAAEDAWAWGGDEQQVVMAVADGLGSFPSSGPVARAVADVAVAAVLAGAADGATAAAATLLAAVGSANDWAARQVDGKATLVLATASRDGTVDLIRVGDSTAFQLRGGMWSELFVPVDADREDGMRTPVTAALPASTPEVETAHCSLQPGEMLILVTDGVGDPLRDGPTTVGPGLASGLAAPLHPLLLAAHADFSRQGCQDDRTIAAMWWGSSPVTE